MDLSFFDRFRPYVSRVIGAGVGAVAGSLAGKLGISVDPVTQASIAGAITIGVYGVIHKVLDKKVNPADSASTHLAVQSQADVAVLKGN